MEYFRANAERGEILNSRETKADGVTYARDALRGSKRTGMYRLVTKLFP